MSTIPSPDSGPKASTLAMEIFPAALEARYLLGPPQPSPLEKGVEITAQFGAAALNIRNARDALRRDDQLAGIVAGGLALTEVVGAAFKTKLLVEGKTLDRRDTVFIDKVLGFVTTVALTASQKFVHRRLGLTAPTYDPEPQFLTDEGSF